MLLVSKAENLLRPPTRTHSRSGRACPVTQLLKSAKHIKADHYQTGLSALCGEPDMKKSDQAGALASSIDSQSIDTSTRAVVNRFADRPPHVPSVQRLSKKIKFKQCAIEGCTKRSVQGGVCLSHGAKRARKRCQVIGCDKIVISAGVCVAHGARVKRCNAPGCQKKAVQGGVCVAHGARVKRCSVEDCDKKAVQGGVCIAHGAKVKRGKDILAELPPVDTDRVDSPLSPSFSPLLQMSPSFLQGNSAKISSLDPRLLANQHKYAMISQYSDQVQPEPLSVIVQREHSSHQTAETKLNERVAFQSQDQLFTSASSKSYGQQLDNKNTHGKPYAISREAPLRFSSWMSLDSNNGKHTRHYLSDDGPRGTSTEMNDNSIGSIEPEVLTMSHEQDSFRSHGKRSPSPTSGVLKPCTKIGCSRYAQHDEFCIVHAPSG